MAVTETHTNENNVEEYTIGNSKYIFFYSGTTEERKAGTGIIVQQDLKPTFKEINNRISQAKIEIDNRKLHIISAYAPTLPKSEKHPEIRDKFYEQLEGIINKIPRRDLVVVLGDFNAKTGSGWKDYPECMGQYGKGQINENGTTLLELAQANNLYLTNTTFNHKLSQRTTWEAPERHFSNTKDQNGNPKPLLGPDGKARRNPFRNQIDYIIVKQQHRRFIQDSKSSGNINTETDHKMVIMKINLAWRKMKKSKVEKSEKIKNKHEQFHKQTKTRRI